MYDESLTDLINDAEASGRPFFSLELIPGTTPKLHQCLEKSLNYLSGQSPLFTTVTWHNAHTTHDSGKTYNPSLTLADKMQNQYRINTCLHLAAGELSKDQVQNILRHALSIGVRNIFALRGDPKPQTGSDFRHGTDLVRFIREQFETKFTIAVPGYPTGHPESSYLEGLLHLKEKVDAGANLIISQVVFRAEDFTSFVADCRKLGIMVPIIPGLLVTEMLPDTSSFERIAALISVAIPPEINENLKRLRDDAAAQKDYIQNLSFHVGRKLLASQKCSGIHFFTMNRCVEAIHIWERICETVTTASS